MKTTPQEEKFEKEFQRELDAYGEAMSEGDTISLIINKEALYQVVYFEMDRVAEIARQEVLREVREDIEGMLVNTPEEVAQLNKSLPSTLQEQAYSESVGYTKAVKDLLSTLESKE